MNDLELLGQNIAFSLIIAVICYNFVINRSSDLDKQYFGQDLTEFELCLKMTLTVNVKLLNLPKITVILLLIDTFDLIFICEHKSTYDKTETFISPSLTLPSYDIYHLCQIIEFLKLL